jgi:transcriptional regulator with XRE-family HTH domain
MKSEKVSNAKPRLTDEDRNHCLRLIGCGLSTDEIAKIMHISKSTVSYIRQAHNACLAQDWSTLQRLSLEVKSTVEWAMKLTGADKVFEETFKDENEEPEQNVEVPAPTTNVPETITREDFLSLSNTLQDISYLLTEIRDILK